MKKLFILLLFILVAGNVYSQIKEVKKIQLNTGVGVADYGIPVYLGADFFVEDNISIGGEINYRSYKYLKDSTIYKIRALCVAAKADYHFAELISVPEPWDIYGGLNLGIVFYDFPKNYQGLYTKTKLLLGIQAGARYFVTKKLGLNFEIGGGSAFWESRFGITYVL